MNTNRTIALVAMQVSVALVSLQLVSGCDGNAVPAVPQESATQSSSLRTIPLDNNPALAQTVRDAIAELRATNPSLNVGLSEDGTLLTGDASAIAELASALTDRYDGNVAMGKHTYCLYFSGPCVAPYRGCHQGRYWNSFFANLDMMAMVISCGGEGGGSVSSGSCPTDNSCIRS